MNLEFDVIKEVAEAKCPTTWHHDPGNREKYNHPEMCACDGTKLRWPPLSRECPSETHDPCTKELAYQVKGMQYYEQIDIRSCDGSGRVPDVTLEKVLDLPELYGVWRAYHGNRKWASKTSSRMDASYSATPLEAACAALLATIS